MEGMRFTHLKHLVVGCIVLPYWLRPPVSDRTARHAPRDTAPLPACLDACGPLERLECLDVCAIHRPRHGGLQRN